MCAVLPTRAQSGLAQLPEGPDSHPSLPWGHPSGLQARQEGANWLSNPQLQAHLNYFADPVHKPGSPRGLAWEPTSPADEIPQLSSLTADLPAPGRLSLLPWGSRGGDLCTLAALLPRLGSATGLFSRACVNLGAVLRKSTETHRLANTLRSFFLPNLDPPGS